MVLASACIVLCIMTIAPGRRVRLWAAKHAGSEGLSDCCAQILWTFSIYLEAVAILPQLVLLQRTQNIDNLTGNYVFMLGCVPH